MSTPNRNGTTVCVAGDLWPCCWAARQRARHQTHPLRARPPCVPPQLHLPPAVLTGQQAAALWVGSSAGLRYGQAIVRLLPAHPWQQPLSSGRQTNPRYLSRRRACCLPGPGMDCENAGRPFCFNNCRGVGACVEGTCVCKPGFWCASSPYPALSSRMRAFLCTLANGCQWSLCGVIISLAAHQGEWTAG